MNETTTTTNQSYYLRNKEKVKARAKAYMERKKHEDPEYGKKRYAAGRERQLARLKERRKGHLGDEIRAKDRERHWRNKERVLARNKERYKLNREAVLEKQRQDRIANPEKYRAAAKRMRNGPRREKLLQWKRDWNAKNAHKINPKRRAYFHSHKAEKAAYDREYRTRNKERIDARVKKWLRDNRDRVNANQRNRRRTDPQFRLSNNLRCRMNTALRNHGTKRDYPMEKLLGCTVAELMDYLSKRFQSGMTWDNHGQWHIDHIKPCAAFDLTDKEQQMMCFHFTNLQPLWSEDNLAKGANLLAA